jgi:hypothetical protein
MKKVAHGFGVQLQAISALSPLTPALNAVELSSKELVGRAHSTFFRHAERSEASHF